MLEYCAKCGRKNKVVATETREVSVGRDTKETWKKETLKCQQCGFEDYDWSLVEDKSLTEPAAVVVESPLVESDLSQWALAQTANRIARKLRLADAGPLVRPFVE